MVPYICHRRARDGRWEGERDIGQAKPGMILRGPDGLYTWALSLLEAEEPQRSDGQHHISVLSSQAYYDRDIFSERSTQPPEY